jgi:hypothetical protein
MGLHFLLQHLLETTKVRGMFAAVVTTRQLAAGTAPDRGRALAS